ncbi:ketoacyl-ACP synthase III family protein [Nocardia mexicana]|uniref:3-oxoacyl-[acyl-carrier-protein] synthase-3 n=1 Tax=Nocardia mexicana TaxID=279262 RepID=A0A370H3X1_9NOCA|nr:ketoacyl-ACP synthase III family protein [Nocardia mexicana]RDI50747.1 3-oxoacyl-[acyl-carrier-protein] synthase-3 [Nocardia mexicana]
MLVAGRISVASAAVRVPARTQTAADAVRMGVLSEDQAHRMEPDRIFVGGQVPPDDFAVAAAEDALKQADAEAGALALVACSWVWERTTNWKLAPRVARLLGADRAFALGVRQNSNGGTASLQVAIGHLLAAPDSATALVVTSDVLPDGAHWRLGMQGAVMSDGAAAVVLTPGPGPLRVLAVDSCGWTPQESLLPDRNPFDGASDVYDAWVDQRTAFSLRKQLRLGIGRALDEAGADRSVDAVLLPRLTSSFLEALTTGLLPPAADRICLTDRTGHLGAGDVLANLAYLLDHDILAPGGRALLIGFGAGFAISCLVVERPIDEEGVLP